MKDQLTPLGDPYLTNEEIQKLIASGGYAVVPSAKKEGLYAWLPTEEQTTAFFGLDRTQVPHRLDPNAPPPKPYNIWTRIKHGLRAFKDAFDERY